MSANIFSKTANAVNSRLDLSFLKIKKREQFSHYTKVKREINLVELIKVKMAGISRRQKPRAKRRHIQILMLPCGHFITNHSATCINAHVEWFSFGAARSLENCIHLPVLRIGGCTGIKSFQHSFLVNLILNCDKCVHLDSCLHLFSDHIDAINSTIKIITSQIKSKLKWRHCGRSSREDLHPPIQQY